MLLQLLPPSKNSSPPRLPMLLLEMLPTPNKLLTSRKVLETQDKTKLKTTSITINGSLDQSTPTGSRDQLLKIPERPLKPVLHQLIQLLPSNRLSRLQLSLLLMQLKRNMQSKHSTRMLLPELLEWIKQETRLRSLKILLDGILSGQLDH